MNFNHNRACLFIANDRNKTMEEMIAEFSDMPADGVKVVFVNRSHTPDGMYPQIEVRFNEDDNNSIYEYLMLKVVKARKYEDTFRASMFAEDIDLKCAYGLANWEQVGACGNPGTRERVPQ